MPSHDKPSLYLPSYCLAHDSQEVHKDQELAALQFSDCCLYGNRWDIDEHSTGKPVLWWIATRILHIYFGWYDIIGQDPIKPYKAKQKPNADGFPSHIPYSWPYICSHWNFPDHQVTTLQTTCDSRHPWRTVRWGACRHLHCTRRTIICVWF